MNGQDLFCTLQQGISSRLRPLCRSYQPEAPWARDASMPMCRALAGHTVHRRGPPAFISLVRRRNTLDSRSWSHRLIRMY